MLRYYYGTMASGKSATLLMNAYQKKKNGNQVILLKPNEKRDKDKIKSRVGLESECITFTPEDDLTKIIFENMEFKGKLEVFVDECQFLTPDQVEQLWAMAGFAGNVINCFGLKTTYKNELFEGIKKLMVFADEIIQLEPTCKCKYCDNVATTHILIVDGKAVLDFPEKFEGDVEGDTRFECVCIKCWYNKVG